MMPGLKGLTNDPITGTANILPVSVYVFLSELFVCLHNLPEASASTAY